MVSHVLIGTPAQATQLVRRNLGPGLGHIEAAITGEAGEQNIFKAKLRSLASGGHILHGRTFQTGLQTRANPAKVEDSCDKDLLQHIELAEPVASSIAYFPLFPDEEA